MPSSDFIPIFDTVRSYLFDCKQIKKNPREVWATDKKLVSLCGTPCLSRFQITLLLDLQNYIEKSIFSTPAQ